MPNPRGFTLIEMLLATVLTAVLMVGVLAVIAQISSPLQRAEKTAQAEISPIDQDTVVSVLYADLAQARTIQTPPNRLHLMGYSSLDPQLRTRTQRPVKIQYLIEEVAGQPWLIRVEHALDADGSIASQTELVAQGVTRILLDPPVDDPPAVLRASVGHRTVEDDSELPGEGLWRLRLWTQGQAPSIDRSLVIRRDAAE